MWELWAKAKTFHLLPSEVFGEEDSIAAWMLDNAVTWFGTKIENALGERVKVGFGQSERYVPKYTLARLLDQGFKFDRPLEKQNQNPWAPLMGVIGVKRSGVKRYRYEKPVD